MLTLTVRSVAKHPFTLQGAIMGWEKACSAAGGELTKTDGAYMRIEDCSEKDRTSDHCKALCRLADIDVEYCTITWAGENPEHPEGYITAWFSGDKLTFEMLAKASELFGTTKINIGCDHGSASDLCHETYITFWGAKGL